MDTFSDELRLALAALLNLAVFVTAYRLARRLGSGGRTQALCDAFLLYFLVQYAAVALPGMIGAFGTTAMTCVALVAAGVMGTAAVFPGRAGQGPGAEAVNTDAPAAGEGAGGWWDADRLGLLGCALFTTAYLGVDAWTQLPLPPMSNDALAYHLPMAAHWMQVGRIDLFPTWYWNPAASYSPGTGSMFMAWWMTSSGNDVLVRFVQLPPLLFLFCLVVRMCRLVGCTATVAGLIGIAATLSRPLISEAVFPKDDLYATAFVVATVLALSREVVRERLGPWRVGVAFGLVLASKYTALLACPVFLFMIDSAPRAGWRARHWAAATVVAGVLTLPWYVRNVVLTGNPLYPVDVHLPGLRLPGLFGTERDQQLRTAGGVWTMLADTYYSLPTPLIVLLLGGWAWAWSAGRLVLRDVLPRAVVLGSAVTLLLFVAASPHHEVRYVFPLIVLWFVAAGLGIARGLRRPGARIAGAAVLAAASTATAFNAGLLATLAFVPGLALVVSALGVGAVILQTRRLRLPRSWLASAASAGVALLAVLVYVQWHAYVETYRASRFLGWGLAIGYPHHAPLWKWVDENVPADTTLAYANTNLVYPYYGFNLTRRVGYAPTRRGLRNFLGFPRIADRLPGDLIGRWMTQVMDGDPDRATWLENLFRMGAGYLVVLKYDPSSPDLDHDPPELKMAAEDPQMFERIYEDEAGVVYRLNGAKRF